MDILTFDRAASEWLTSKQEVVRQLSYEKYRQVINAHLGYFNEMNMLEISEKDVDSFFYLKENDEKLSNSMLYAIRFVLKSIFDYAHKHYDLNTVFIKNRAQVARKNKNITLNDKQRELISDYVKHTIDNDSLSIVLSLYLGLRTGEICALRVENIDFYNNVIYVNKSVERIKNIGEKGRLVILDARNDILKRKIVMSSLVREFLLGYVERYNLGKSDFLISQSIKVVDPRTIQRNLSIVCKTLGFKCDFNTLRNTFITTCLKNNMNFKYLCKIIGTINFKGIYELCPEIEITQEINEMNKSF